MPTSLSLTNPEREEAFSANRRKWLILAPAGVLLLGVGAFSCNRALNQGKHEAYELAEQFHAEIAKRNWSGIYADADPKYRETVSSEGSAEMFAGVVRKLGVPLSCKQGGTTLQADTSGSRIISECETTFSLNSKGEETFIWHKSDGKYRLIGYHLSSPDLLTR